MDRIQEMIACVLIEQESCLEPGKLEVGGARCATLHMPRFSSGVVALNEVGEMGIKVQGL